MSLSEIRAKKQDPVVLYLSLAIAACTVLMSLTGIFSQAFYARETPNWQVQSMGQDVVDLFLIVPVLLITTVFAWKRHFTGTCIWAGTLVYLQYTFLIYCFGVHFNKLFPVYCITLGLSVYTLLYVIYARRKSMASPDHSSRVVIHMTGYYLLLIAVLFYLLWLSEVIPAIYQGVVPKSLAAVGLPTNPVHVIDLSVFLPGVFITGLLLLRRRTLGYLLAPVVLTFFILMDVTIGVLMIFIHQHGLEGSPQLASVMLGLAFISAVLLVLNLRQFKSTSVTG
jgi:hypothetical protein